MDIRRRGLLIEGNKGDESSGGGSNNAPGNRPIFPIVDYSSSYFTVEALEDGLTAKLSGNACECRIDDGNWITLSANTDTPSINKGQKLSFKGNLTPSFISGIGRFTVNKAFNVEGNIMSLLYGDNFKGQISLSGKNYTFYNLFYNCTTLKNAKNLILPATTLANYCYSCMFIDCTSLTEAPELPATTLKSHCYSLMFGFCSNLNYIKMIATDINASNCLNNWVIGVASSGTFVKHSQMTSLLSGDSGIPNGWTVQDYNS